MASASKKNIAIYNRDVALNRLLETEQLANAAVTDNSVKMLFQVRSGMLEAHYNEFLVNNSKVVSNSTVNELEEQANKAVIADRAFFAAKEKCDILFPKHEPVTVPPVNVGPPNPIINYTNNVHLPKLSVPKFDGDLKNWQTFHDMFNTLINDKDSLTNVEKFQYLVSALSGPPLSLISSLQITHNNYLIAYDLLVKRYQNKRALATEHWKAIQSAPTIHKDSPDLLLKTIDILTKNLAALDLLGFETNRWDFVLFSLLLDKLDVETKKAFEREFTKTELPSFNQLKTFVTDYSMALARVKQVPSKLSVNAPKYVPNNQRVVKSHTVSVVGSQSKCNLCHQSHYLSKCPDFLKLSPNDRHCKIKELQLCNNCLRDHPIKNCSSKFNCKHCNLRHHSLLHFERAPNALFTSEFNAEDQPGPSTSANPLTVLTNNFPASQSLLATAVVRVANVFGNFHSCRCLLDPGSQSNFVTESFSKKLGLSKTNIKLAVQGISQSAVSISSKLELQLHSQYINFQSNISCFVLPCITSNLPSCSFPKNSLSIPTDVLLADPDFNISKDIDILLGVTMFWDILLPGRKSLGSNRPILQETKLGWIVSGSIPFNASFSCFTVCNLETESLSNDILLKFWQIEEPQLSKPALSLDERKCEDHFIATTRRDQLGRFVVQIPFTESLFQLGQSRDLALRRFFLLEKRLDRLSSLKEQYATFMSEYESLGHMTEVQPTSTDDGYYIPHHAVVKNSISTKLRVVFDASMATNTGISLNKAQLVGPVIQSDLLAILLRFRQYAFVLSGDIRMMYRQILVDKPHRKYQKIFWRSNVTDKLKVFELNTVTYGTASAPYLATRCLQQLADDNKQSHALAAHVIATDFYVDDLITGSNSLNTLIRTRDEICEILSSAGFELRKFMSNDAALLNVSNADTELQILNFGDHENCKTLGVIWNSDKDVIQFSIKISNFISLKPTKRNILSMVSSIFDPLGLLSPVIFTAKLLIQSMWELKLDWDDLVPDNLVSVWNELRDELQWLNSLEIPRHSLIQNPIIHELHGFCDASQRAYGACIYMRSLDSLNNVKVNLLISKSKVAPLRKVTLPRLELCGAYLLSNLTTKVIAALPNLHINRCQYWCDSTIVLHWINGAPNRWKTFVSNRVASIQECTKISDWRHIDSLNNPADIVSRGAAPSALIRSHLWWHGPPVLHNIEIIGSTTFERPLDIPEQARQTTCCSALLTETINCDIFHRFGSYDKLIRVTAYILRWKQRVLLKTPHTKPLLPSELKYAKTTLLKVMQQQSFAREIHELQNHGRVNHSSKILALSPFLDVENLLRVGGRLQNSSLSYSAKHPILLCNKHPLSTLIMRFEHIRLLHCGQLTLLHSVRQQFWPINGRELAKKVVRGCVSCFRVKPFPQPVPIMGNLPSVRVQENPVFKNVGIDYAGPFLLRNHKLRGFKLIKCYIALFICMCTKALHLELVTELSAEAFIATFRRFAGRRGKPDAVYSDNGGNFVGANRELKELANFLKAESIQNYISNELNKDNIEWHFIPARSPTFGGLWESGVRLVKHHIYRVVKNVHLTYENFYTILIQVEAIVNSRPLTPLSPDPHDLNPLTPGHFLIGRPLVQIPDGNYMNISTNRLNQYQRLQQMTQHIWARWQKEYFNYLQVRQKWKSQHPSLIQIGALVLIKDENAPPMKWRLGRITDIFPGDVRAMSRAIKNCVQDYNCYK